MKLSRRCYAVTGLGFIPPWEVNAGFVVGDRTTLVVDTGPSDLAARTVHGYAVSARPGNEMLVVNTEPHADHLLGNGLFAERSIPIWGHQLCERQPDTLDLNMAELNATIRDPARRRRNEAAIFFGGSRVVNPTRRISAETRFDLGGVEVAAIPAPGHTPGNLVVHVAADRVLFAGDTVVAGYLPNLHSGGPAQWEQWLAALALVRRLEPGILVPGHGRVLQGREIGEEISRIEKVLRDAIG